MLGPNTGAKYQWGCGHQEEKPIPAANSEQHSDDAGHRQQRQDDHQSECVAASHAVALASSRGLRLRRRSHHSHAPLAVMNRVNQVQAVHNNFSDRPP